MNRRSFLRACGAGLATVALSTRLAATTQKLVHEPLTGDFDTSTLRYKAYERYSAAWTDARAFAASEHRTQQLLASLQQTKFDAIARVLQEHHRA